MPSNKKIRITYKNIIITYHNCFEIPLEEIKAFFTQLFKKIYANNTIKYFLVAKNKIDQIITILIILDKRPNFKTINNFIINDDEPIFEPFRGTITTFKNNIKDDDDFEWLELGQLPTFNNPPQFKEKDEIEEEFYIFLDNLKERFDNFDKKMTTAEASKEIDIFFIENAPQLKYKKIMQVDKILKKYFTRTPIYDFEDDDIEKYQTFKNDLPILIKIKNIMKKAAIAALEKLLLILIKKIVLTLLI